MAKTKGLAELRRIFGDSIDVKQNGDSYKAIIPCNKNDSGFADKVRDLMDAFASLFQLAEMEIESLPSGDIVVEFNEWEIEDPATVGGLAAYPAGFLSRRAFEAHGEIDEPMVIAELQRIFAECGVSHEGAYGAQNGYTIAWTNDSSEDRPSFKKSAQTKIEDFCKLLGVSCLSCMKGKDTFEAVFEPELMENATVFDRLRRISAVGETFLLEDEVSAPSPELPDEKLVLSFLNQLSPHVKWRKVESGAEPVYQTMGKVANPREIERFLMRALLDVEPLWSTAPGEGFARIPVKCIVGNNISKLRDLKLPDEMVQGNSSERKPFG